MRHLSTAALIRRDDKLLFVRRPPGGDLSECWELPGGKVDAGEQPRQALRRELLEELGVDSSVGPAAGEAHFSQGTKAFRLIGYEVELDCDAIELHEHEEMAFLTVEAALALRLAPSDAALLRAVRERIDDVIPGDDPTPR